MKITRHFKHLAVAALLTVGLAVTGCASSGGKSTRVFMKNAKFIPLYHVKNTGDELNLKKATPVAMACAKCKTVLFADVNRPKPILHAVRASALLSGLQIHDHRDGRAVLARRNRSSSDACGSDSARHASGTPPTEDAQRLAQVDRTTRTHSICSNERIKAYVGENFLEHVLGRLTEEGRLMWLSHVIALGAFADAEQFRLKMFKQVLGEILQDSQDRDRVWRR